MQVETFEISEVKADCPDDKEKLLTLAKELGLSGQEKLLKGGDESTTFPYRLMSKAENRIYAALLTTKEPLEDFDAEVIPLRVLQVAAHAKQFPQTRYLEVWHNAAMKDPILTGKKERWDGREYILARWGEVLESLPVLRKRAKEILVPQVQCAIAEVLNTCKQNEASMDSLIDIYLSGSDKQDRLLPSLHW